MQPRKGRRSHDIFVVQIATASQSFVLPNVGAVGFLFAPMSHFPPLLLSGPFSSSLPYPCWSVMYSFEPDPYNRPVIDSGDSFRSRDGDLTSTNVNVELALILLAEVTGELLGTATWRNIWMLEIQLSPYVLLDAKLNRDGVEGVRVCEDRGQWRTDVVPGMIVVGKDVGWCYSPLAFHLGASLR